MPFFSVVIPLYNKANFIQHTLESVLSQNFQDFEIIIIDDGSTDHSVKVVESIDDDRIHLYHQVNKGASAARNYGVSVSQARWITLLDADDIWYKAHLLELHRTISTRPKADVVSNGYEIQLSPTFIKTPSYNCNLQKGIQYVENYFKCSLIDSLFWTSSIAFKREVFLGIGGFDEDLNTGQDLDLFIRLALNYKLAYNSKITLKYQRETENNLSRQVTLVDKYKYIRKHQSAEISNSGLKAYLDINRFSLAMQAKQANNTDLAIQLESEIDQSNLNTKQKVLLKLPNWSIRTFKSIQLQLIKLGIYKSAFS